jgi:DNA polymerase-3 subunit epsilon
MWFRRPSPPATLLALDLETSGLDPRHDVVLSAGWVPVADGSVLWGERFHAFVAGSAERPRDPEALAVHQILPSETRDGITLGALLDHLEAALGGHGMFLVHGGGIERRFLRAAARSLGRPVPRLPMLDTLPWLLEIETHRHHLADRLPRERRQQAIPSTLEAARAYFDLPPYPAHHALLDALATAELYLLLHRRFPELAPRPSS